jgi:hypothetical protein
MNLVIAAINKEQVKKATEEVRNFLHKEGMINYFTAEKIATHILPNIIKYGLEYI